MVSLAKPKLHFMCTEPDGKAMGMNEREQTSCPWIEGEENTPSFEEVAWMWVAWARRDKCSCVQPAASE